MEFEEAILSAEKQALRKLIRSGFDLLLDYRHWQCLCKVSRQTKKSVSDVLAGILEKVFLVDLKMISALDDDMDRPIKNLRCRIERFRLQPQKLQKLLQERKNELLILAEAFPEELDPFMFDVVTRLKATYCPARVVVGSPRPEVPLTDEALDELARKLSLRRGRYKPRKK